MVVQVVYTYERKRTVLVRFHRSRNICTRRDAFSKVTMFLGLIVLKIREQGSTGSYGRTRYNREKKLLFPVFKKT